MLSLRTNRWLRKSTIVPQRNDKVSQVRFVFSTTQSFSYYFEFIIPYIIKNSCNFATNKNLDLNYNEKINH